MLLWSTRNLEKQVLFFRQLATILQSGLPLLDGLAFLQRQKGEESLLYYRLQSSLQHGRSLAEALAAEQNVFSSFAVQMVAAGEESGELSSLLGELADYYARQDRLLRFIKQAVLYPCLLLLLALLVLVMFGVYILPVLLETYTAMGLQVDGRLALVVKARDFLMSNCLPGFALLVLLLFVCVWGGKALLHKFLRSGWSGNFHGLLIEVRLCKLLALLLQAGLPITRAVRIVAETVADEESKTQLEIFRSRLQRGLVIEEAAAATEKLFSPLALELICVGAATGYLPEMLHEAAAAGGVRLEEQLKRLRQLLVPVLLLIAALVVAAVVLTIIGPLFELLTALPE